MIIMTAARTMHVQTASRGAVPHGATEFAVRRIRSLVRHAPEPVLFARVTLVKSADPAATHAATAQANLDLNGRLIRAEAAGKTMHEAVERMSDRLRIRLQRAARNWAAIRGSRRARTAAGVRYR